MDLTLIYTVKYFLFFHKEMRNARLNMTIRLVTSLS